MADFTIDVQNEHMILLNSSHIRNYGLTDRMGFKYGWRRK